MIDELLKDMTSMISFKASEKEIELLYDVEETLPSRYVGDSLRLQQVLLNLISNAIKFSHENGTVLVTLRGLKEVDEMIELQFRGRFRKRNI